MYSLHFDWVAKSPFKCLTCGNNEGRKIQDLKNHRHLRTENLLRFLWFPFTVSDASGRAVLFRISVWLRLTATRRPALPLGFLVALKLPFLLFLFLLFSACFLGLSVSVAFICRLWFHRASYLAKHQKLCQGFRGSQIKAFKSVPGSHASGYLAWS